MKFALPLLATLVLAMSACAERSPPPSESAAAPSPTPAPAEPVDQPSEDVPPATAPAKPVAEASADGARYDGYGPARFGMSAEALKRAWKGELAGKPGESGGCYYLSPAGQKTVAEFALMIEGDQFVRFDVRNEHDIAPGGGKRGMTREQILALYPGVEEQPHKYVEGAKNLRVSDAGGGVLIFSTDAKGQVTEWRAGRPPQVDYVEGCS